MEIIKFNWFNAIDCVKINDEGHSENNKTDFIAQDW